MHALKKFLANIAYKTKLIYAYHFVLARLAAFRYGFPADKMIVIGVTGTNGKSTTVGMIAHMLSVCGYKVGQTSTVQFQIGEEIRLNDKKMTMLGRFQLQKMLREMVDAGCVYAVIETSSEGMRQFRHVGISYDVAVFTNLTPEHIESHGGFDNYRKAKRLLFKAVESRKPKTIRNPKTDFKENVPRLIVANADSEFARYYAGYGSDKTILYSMADTKECDILENPDTFGTEQAPCRKVKTSYAAREIRCDAAQCSCVVNDTHVEIGIPGEFNVSNALAALAVCDGLGADFKTCAESLKNFSIPGRMETIATSPIRVIVDYAPEPESLKQLYNALKNVEYNRLIHILGSAGGGRDVVRREVLGGMAGARADMVIVANEDPYDEDPERIIEMVADGARKTGKVDGKNLFMFSDRKDAFKFAYKQANEGDLIISTGKGSEQCICVANGEKIPWDERNAWREIIDSKS